MPSNSFDELTKDLVADSPPDPADDHESNTTLLHTTAGSHAGRQPLRQALGRWGVPPLAVLTSINLIDNLDRAAFITLAPDIRRTFGVSQAAITGIAGISSILVVVAAVPFAIAADRGNRLRLVWFAASLWSVLTLLTGVVVSIGQLALARITSGIGQAAIEPVHNSLLTDYYPAESRGRVFSIHQMGIPIASIVGPALAGGIAAIAGWRWAFFAIAPIGLVAAFATKRLKEPPRSGARPQLEALEEIPTVIEMPNAVPFRAGVRQLLAIPSLRAIYFATGVLGFGLVSAPVLISDYFESDLHLDSFERGLVFAIIGFGTFLGLPFGGIASDNLFRRSPAWSLYVAGAGLTLYTVLVSAGMNLPLPFLIIALTIASLGTGLIIAPVRQVVAAASPARLTALSFAMLGVFILLFGGFFGGVILGSIADATSTRTALSMLLIPGMIGITLIIRGAGHVVADIARADEANRQEQDGAASGALLTIRNIDFSYGTTQVLFGVSLEVPKGEVVALLGTNGAGKSTLLRAVCGLGHPTRGSITFDGTDITYTEAEDIVGLGITQMPGGKAVFPGLTVRENLLAGAYSFRKDKERVQRDIAQVEEWFPVLRERRSQMASTLSGGEQQMLALSKAFLTRPTLLCIDELSLGLAPSIVEKLFAIVKEIHANGTTILIVEQSLNVALSLATTATFMEKGQVRFSGPAQELLERPDIVRSVFLAGAAT